MAEEKFEGKNYKDFKESVASTVNTFLSSFQKRYQDLRESEKLKEILMEGAEKASKISHPKLLEVYEKLGFVKS